MIHEQLRQARIAQGLRQKELSNMTGLTPATISYFERGTTQGLGTAYKIAEALGMELTAVKIKPLETPPPPLDNDLTWE